MGGACSKKYDSLFHSEGYYKIEIKTGWVKGQTVKKNGTTCLRLHNHGKDETDGKPGEKPETHRLIPNRRWLSRGSKHTFCIYGSKLSDITHVEAWLERSGNNTDLKWFVEYIAITEINGKRTVYSFHRWITMKHQVIQCQSSLPQDDQHSMVRKASILIEHEFYHYNDKKRAADCIPVMSDYKQIPEEQQFSLQYLWDVFILPGAGHKFVAAILPHFPFTCKWRSLTNTGNVYKWGFKKPKCVDKYVKALNPAGQDGQDWKSLDKIFGAQRISGTNPAVIQRVMPNKDKKDVSIQYVMDRMELDSVVDEVKDILGMTLQEAVDQEKLYMVDYTDILTDLQCGNGVVAAPIALFFTDEDNCLMPLAIRLFPSEPEHYNGQDNPVFLPTDDPYTWLLAKMWFNNADASYHQSVSHLGFTHLLMESVYIAVRRTLSLSHPMYRLMAGHFLFVLKINNLAWSLLINKGGWVDTSMTIGVKGMFSIIKRKFEGHKSVPAWRLDKEGDINADIQQRGVKDLPNYFFRDDAVELRGLIREYVETIVNHHYSADQALKQDQEIQAWAEMLTNKADDGGCGIQGVPGNGKFSSNDELIDTVTSIIYICSVSHAAVNFQQYDEYGYPLNYPALLNGDPPRTKNVPMTEADVLGALPSKPSTLQTMVITSLLSTRKTASLGTFKKETTYQHDKVAVDALDRFTVKVKEMGDRVAERKQYDVLNPRYIPNAISI